ncbi:TetR/AcrR family transcriptional regulator C-terminal domain-containing protein [Pigmentibacter sp. JX0631]|uniref:TetR/AcrR family transcriptional regulator C-terminal domain-containing protein n=1 Tax=Pigmentibacter sp. JX0631 TaxID=2976982 RepID=UPI002469BD18|nr:TetR/AcrR family transcriptional regulator C-terminal domain-containing protein [Pigmentibacter sp. JX0631]WGL59469.1 TetR/AcrR family transcriptional regulator C-terminal domain-containing protein [Pigmentibacter sp. JX0631]
MNHSQSQNIINAALELLDEVGFEGLTMRKLADKLNIKAPTLYWHFKNKQELIDKMADSLFSDVALVPLNNEMKWSDQVKLISKEIRQALLSRRDGGLIYAGTVVPTENVFRVYHAVVNPLINNNIQSIIAGRFAFNILYFVLGFVIEEQGSKKSIEKKHLNKLTDSSNINLQNVLNNNLNTVLEDLFSDNDEDRFEFGLDLLCKGLMAILNESP